MENSKKLDQYKYDGLGFPVILQNVPMIKVRGNWTPDINLNELIDAVFRMLPHKKSRLAGNEIKFIRHHCNMTLHAFGERFDVTHAAVKKWENCGNKHTNMSWTTEKDIRLFILDGLQNVGSPDFMRTYRELVRVPEGRSQHKYDYTQAVCSC